MMRRFAIRSVLFCSPLLLYAALIALCDPFQYFFRRSPLLSDEIQQQVAGRINYAIDKCVAYRNDPSPNILLGDSRIALLDAQEIAAVAGESYFNFALGGGTLAEVCDLFDFAAELAARRGRPLRHVVIGVNFSLYNGSVRGNRAPDAVALLSNPLLYLCHRDVLRAVVRCLAVQYGGASAAVERPPMSLDRFWDYQLQTTVAQTYSKYRYPTEYFARLQHISEYCRRQHVELLFLIPPTHVDLQRRAADFGLTAAEERFRADLASLGRVIDFDYPSELTTNRAEYGDPFHGNQRVRTQVIQEVWGDPTQRRYARVYGPTPRGGEPSGPAP